MLDAWLNRQRVPYKADVESRVNSDAVAAIAEATRPGTVIHGHYHYPYRYSGERMDVLGLGCDGMGSKAHLITAPATCV